MNRAELIAALVTDKYSGFKDGDQAMLETASDARLEEFRTAADAAKTTANNVTRLDNDLRNAQARVKVSEDKLRVAEQPMTEEDFLAKAPEKIKAILTALKAAEDAERDAIIIALKERGVNTEEDLKKKTTDELKTLAAYARVDVPDFSGRALPRAAQDAGKISYAPPNPYESLLNPKKSDSKAVN